MTEPTDPAEGAAAPETIAVAALPALVEAWFAKTFANSVFSRSIELGNAFAQAKDELKATLTKGS